MLLKLLALMKVLGPKIKDAWPVILEIIQMIVPAQTQEAGRIMRASSAQPESPELQEIKELARSCGLDESEVAQTALMLQDQADSKAA